MHVTDTQLIQINAGSLGVAVGTPIPSAKRDPQPGRQELYDQRNPRSPNR